MYANSEVSAFLVRAKSHFLARGKAALAVQLHYVSRLALTIEPTFHPTYAPDNMISKFYRKAGIIWPVVLNPSIQRIARYLLRFKLIYNLNFHIHNFFFNSNIESWFEIFLDFPFTKRKKDQTLQQQQQQQKTIVEEEWLLECPLCRDLHEASSFLPRRKKKNFSFLGQTRRSRILLRAIYRDNRSYATFQKIHPYRPVRPLDRRSPLR